MKVKIVYTITREFIMEAKDTKHAREAVKRLDTN